MAKVTGDGLDPDRRRRDGRARQGRRARQARRACDLATVKLSKVGGIGEANGDRRRGCRSTSRARSTGRSGSPPPPMPRRRCAFDGPAAGLAHGLATQLLFAETIATRGVRAPRRRTCHLPDGPGLGRRARRGRARPRTGSSVSVRAVDPTNRNTALASAMVEELARCGVAQAVICPGLALDPARAGALARAGDRGAGDRRRALRRVLRARRRAGDRHAGRRSSAPRAPPRRTSTPPSARPTSRRCR